MESRTVAHAICSRSELNPANIHAPGTRFGIDARVGRRTSSQVTGRNITRDAGQYPAPRVRDRDEPPGPGADQRAGSQLRRISRTLRGRRGTTASYPELWPARNPPARSAVAAIAVVAGRARPAGADLPRLARPQGLRLGADRLRRRHPSSRWRPSSTATRSGSPARRPGATSRPAGPTSSPGATSAATRC